MNFKEVKKLISEKLNWSCQDIYYLCTDKDMFAYYIVYRNHKIRCICAIDEINGLVSGIWN